MIPKDHKVATRGDLDGTGIQDRTSPLCKSSPSLWSWREGLPANILAFHSHQSVHLGEYKKRRYPCKLSDLEKVTKVTVFKGRRDNRCFLRVGKTYLCSLT